MSAYGRPSLEQARINARKVARIAIRAKHSIAADNELNEVMPLLDIELAKMVQQGRTPKLGLADIERLISGDEE